MRCTYNYCGNSESQDSPQISFHRFPRKKQRRRLWLLAMGLPNFTPLSRDVVCSAHFKEDDYRETKTKDGRRLLKSSAVPSRNLGIRMEDACYEEEAVEEDLVSNTENPLLNVMDEEDTCYEVEALEVDLVSNMENPPLNVVNKRFKLRTFEDEEEKMTLKRALMTSDEAPSVNESAIIATLKSKINVLRANLKKKDLKIRTLGQKVRRQSKRIASLSEIITTLTNKNLVTKKVPGILSGIGGVHKDTASKICSTEKINISTPTPGMIEKNIENENNTLYEDITLYEDYDYLSE